MLKIFDNMTDLNENKYFIGLMMILVNIGSRFIIGELSDTQKKLINEKLKKIVYFWCIFYGYKRYCFFINSNNYVCIAYFRIIS